jgi:hypothetical protein
VVAHRIESGSPTASCDFAHNPNEMDVWTIHTDGSFKKEWQLQPSEWGPAFL